MLKRTSSIIRLLYTNNPFYIISAVCVLYAIHKMLNGQNQTEYSSLYSLGALFLYISILNLVGIFIIRFGKVWDDARTILIILILLLLAFSTSIEDLIVKNRGSGPWYLLGFYLFSLLQLGCFIYWTKIKLSIQFILWSSLTLFIFIMYPSILISWVQPNDIVNLNMSVFLFPFCISLVCFISMIRMNQNIKSSETPWIHPWFPWLFFFLILLAALFKTYSMSLSYIPGKDLDSIFGSHFLFPILLAKSFFILQVALFYRKKHIFVLSYLIALSSVFFSFPIFGKGKSYIEFQEYLQSIRCSPIQISSILLMLLGLFTLYKKLPYSKAFLMISTLCFATTNHQTIDLTTLNFPGYITTLLALGGMFYYWTLKRNSQSLMGCLVILQYLIYGPAIQFEWTEHSLIYFGMSFYAGATLIPFIYKDKVAQYIEYFCSFLAPLIFLAFWFANTTSWTRDLGEISIYFLFFILFVNILIKKSLLFLYFMLLPIAVMIFDLHYEAFKVLLTLDLQKEVGMLLLGILFLAMGSLISFKKGKMISFMKLKHLGQKSAVLFSEYHQTTINQPLAYLQLTKISLKVLLFFILILFISTLIFY